MINKQKKTEVINVSEICVSVCTRITTFIWNLSIFVCCKIYEQDHHQEGKAKTENKKQNECA